MFAACLAGLSVKMLWIANFTGISMGKRTTDKPSNMWLAYFQAKPLSHYWLRRLIRIRACWTSHPRSRGFLLSPLISPSWELEPRIQHHLRGRNPQQVNIRDTWVRSCQRWSLWIAKDGHIPSSSLTYCSKWQGCLVVESIPFSRCDILNQSMAVPLWGEVNANPCCSDVTSSLKLDFCSMGSAPLPAKASETTTVLATENSNGFQTLKAMGQTMKLMGIQTCTLYVYIYIHIRYLYIYIYIYIHTIYIYI